MRVRTIFISNCEDNIKLIHNEIQKSNIDLIIQHTNSKELAAALLKDMAWDLILFDYQSSSLDYTEIISLREELCPNVPIILIYKEIKITEIIEASHAGINNFTSILELTSIYESLEFAINDINKRIEQRRPYGGISSIRTNLRFSEDTYRLAVEENRDVIWNWNILANQLIVSDEWQERIVFPNHIDKSFDEYIKRLVHPADSRNLLQLQQDYLDKKNPYFRYECRLVMNSGEYRWVLIKGKAIWDDDNQPTLMIGHMVDITEQKRLGERANYLTYYDHLTGLANRVLFEYKLCSTIARLKFEKCTDKVAIIYLDIDNLSTFNEVRGHVFGDQLLKEIASILVMTLSNNCIISRFGGDEFAVLIPNVVSIDQIHNVAEKLMSLFNDELIINDFPVLVSVSMGIALYPEDGKDEQMLIKNAHTAMRFSKQLGKDNYQLYHVRMNEKVVRKLQMEMKLREAIKNNEFTVFYQPQVNIENGKIESMEALIRWIHPNEGMIPPVEFISIAEERDLIIPIGEFVLRTACKQNKLWQEKGHPCKRVAVNISAKQLKDKDFVYAIKKVLEETGLDAKWLEVEITESLIMDNLELAIDILSELRELGVYIALDDFGTGYSSLNYLTRLPIDTLKIDKSFIDKIHTGSNEQAITKAIIGLAHNIKLGIVAEGVEINEQLLFLREYECDKVQGYLFSKPLPAEEFELMLSAEDK
jgi:diguanylate cyclase (GGDEF)-like protein/PAS domain S-box-containing protein